MYVPLGFIQVILQADKTSNNFSDRAILKNLGHWLGMQTLAKNRPILQIVSKHSTEPASFPGFTLAPPQTKKCTVFNRFYSYSNLKVHEKTGLSTGKTHRGNLG